MQANTYTKTFDVVSNVCALMHDVCQLQLWQVCWDFVGVACSSDPASCCCLFLCIVCDDSPIPLEGAWQKRSSEGAMGVTMPPEAERDRLMAGLERRGQRRPEEEEERWEEEWYEWSEESWAWHAGGWWVTEDDGWTWRRYEWSNGEWMERMWEWDDGALSFGPRAGLRARRSALRRMGGSRGARGAGDGADGRGRDGGCRRKGVASVFQRMRRHRAVVHSAAVLLSGVALTPCIRGEHVRRMSSPSENLATARRTGYARAVAHVPGKVDA